MTRRALVLLPIVALALAALPASAHPVRIGRYAEIPYGIRADHFYATVRGDARRTGRLRGVLPRDAPVLRWERTIRHRQPRGPAIAADGTLYVGHLGGLTSLAPDGTERWTALVGAVRYAPSFLPSGDVVVVTRAGLLAVVSPEGVVRRSVALGVPAMGSTLVLDDGSVVVGTADRRLHRRDVSLRSVFETELRDPMGSTATRTGRGLVAVVTGLALRLYDARGALVREIALGSRPSTPIAVADDGTLWVGTSDGAVLAIDPNGRVRSRTELATPHYEGAALAVGRDGAVRLPTIREGLVCIGPGGSERWRVASSAGYRTSVHLDDEDTAVAVDSGGIMTAVAADGTERWRVTLPTYVSETPVLGLDGTLYVLTDNGGLQAWGR
jgi:outer membrane protein assembly factor BamB